MEDMARWCDNIVVMAKSEVIMSGSRDEIFERSSELAMVGLDIPQITRLVMILRDRGIDIDERIYTVDSAKKALLKIFESKVKK
jgi:energy-coupling factor transport system ATP-binding protein